MEWQHSLKNTPHQCNRALGVLRAMIRWSIRLDLCQHDPTIGIQRIQVQSRYRFLSQDEVSRLLDTLERAEQKISLFVRMTLATGCRRGEAQQAQWKDIDMSNKRWTKPKTKRGQWQIVPLPDQIISELEHQHQQGPWIFPGQHSKPWSLAGIEKAWGKVRTACNLSDVRLHDLRRTTASHMAINGENLSTIQKMLDHSSLQTTPIYARLDLHTLSQAMQRNADRFFTQEQRPC